MAWVILASVVALGAVVPISYLVEALRRAPTPPAQLGWAADLPIRYVEVGGIRIRYVTAGQGPPLLMLHTLRTQLDMFQRVIPELAQRFSVYALDYPGHGYSDIPPFAYTPELFVGAVAGFLERLDLGAVLVVGESIGGTVALLLAARHDPRVRAVVAVNPYDYAAGRGLRRSSVLANVLFGLNNVPVLGETVARLRQYPMVKRVLQGGVYRKEALPDGLAREIYQVGNRPGHYRAFMSLVRHWPEWEQARAEYPNIDRPVLLLYGDHDWSRPEEQQAEQRVIPDAKLRMVPNAGHFLSLDAPQELVRAVAEFARDL